MDTLDNEAELDEISGNEDISEQDDAASQLDNNDKIEDETSEQFETINNPVYNEVENNGFGINDVNQAVDAKEAYEAEIRDMSQDEYHDQKELDKRVEENGSEPNMTEPSVLGNDLHQGDVSNKETDNRSRLNEVEQNPGVERSVQETPEDLSLKEKALKQDEISKQYYDKCNEIGKDDMIDTINDEKSTNISHVDSDDMEEFMNIYNRYKENPTKEFPEISTEDAKYGLSGEAAPWVNDQEEQLSEGGANQEWIPMRVVDFKRIGVFEED